MATLIQNLPQNIDYELWQGDTWAPGTITATVSGTPINFTGYTATMEIRNAISNDVALTLTSTPAAGITLTSLGVITITMTATQTNALLGEYSYDLQITSPTSVIKTYTYGTISVLQDNTNN
jgi:hypothetical protein